MESLTLIWVSSLLTIILVIGFYSKIKGIDYGRELRECLFCYKKSIIMTCSCFLLPPIKAIRELVGRGFIVVITYKQTKEYPVSMSNKELRRMFKVFSFMDYLILWGLK